MIECSLRIHFHTCHHRNSFTVVMAIAKYIKGYTVQYNTACSGLKRLTRTECRRG